MRREGPNPSSSGLEFLKPERQLGLVFGITEKINRGSDSEEVLGALYSELQGLIPYNRLAIAFLKEDGHTLQMGPIRSDGPIILATGYQESLEGSSLLPLIERGETRIIDDLKQYLLKKPQSKSTRLITREGMQSNLTVPLIAAGKPIGVMFFSSRAKGAYSWEHESFLRMIAGHVAITIEKGRLIRTLEENNAELAKANDLKAHFLDRLQDEVRRQTDALQRSEERLGILLRITKAIHSSLDLNQVFDTLVESIRPVGSFERASILVLSENERVLRFWNIEPRERQELGRDSVIPLEGSAAGEAIRRGRTLHTKDLNNGSQFYEDAFLLRAEIRSRLCIPLFVQGRPIGTFNLASKAPNQFSDQQVAFLEDLAGAISVAVANAGAYKEIEQLKNQLQTENIQLREAVILAPDLGALIGESQLWKKVLKQVEMVATSDTTVLIRGETGTGKELIARAIHRLSPRRDKPFVTVNCGALSPELIASELFGHEKGAFTGAMQRKLGRLQLADQGTVLLDEVGELPLDIQVKLLRVLQEREFERVGGTSPIKVNIRIVAATNRDLERARTEGHFRDDLYYRLNVFPVFIPSLRERPEDIEPLLIHFVGKYSQKLHKSFDQIDRRTLQRCLQYHWPGNVRELENLVERHVVLCEGARFSMDPFVEAEAVSREDTLASTLNDAIRTHLVSALRTTRGKIYGKDGAAQLLGIKPSTLQAKMKKLNISRAEVIDQLFKHSG